MTAGNPYLDPFEADAYDLSFEWYFAEESLLSLALFYKDIEPTFSHRRATRGRSPAIPTACRTNSRWQPAATSAGLHDTRGLAASRCRSNTPGGDLKGFEVSYQQPFTFLAGFWGNFGVHAQLHLRRLRGGLPEPSTARWRMRTDLTGLSQNAYNATLYYEDDQLTRAFPAPIATST